MENKEVLTKNYVIKRNGRKEEVYLDKITSRIQKLCYELNMDFVDPVTITLQVIKGLYAGITTVELDNLAAEIAVSKTTVHSDYALLAARIAITNLHKETKKLFSDVIEDLYNAHKNFPESNSPLISNYHYKIINENAARLNSCIIYDRDFLYNYFGFKTLEKSYLLRINDKVAERPQHMLMRVAIGIHGEDIDAAIETYNMLSEGYFIHTSTTLAHACAPNAQLMSKFLMMMPDDSIEGIYDCLNVSGEISSKAGSVGINIHNIRAKGTYIAGTNGVSNGLIPMLKVFDRYAMATFQAGSKQQSKFTIYLEPWHADIFDYLMHNRSNKEEIRTNYLEYALWIPDLFMKRVENNEMWSLMCPHKSPGLSDVWGDKFDVLYKSYESAGNYIKQIEARKLWEELTTQSRMGAIALLYKDTCNRKSNQKHLGTIKGGSATGEVIAYTSRDEIAACPIASIALDKFVQPDRKAYDFEHLKKVTKIVTRNLNKIIDINWHPNEDVQRSFKKHRPIGVSVQGLADAFVLMRMPFGSEEAAKLNKQIFETIYYGALEESCEIAERYGPYQSYKGSPISEGILQYDMWDVTPTDLCDWKTLKERIAKYGVRNSQLVAISPTKTTANILGNEENIEPYSCNICTKRTFCGEFTVVNKHLIKDLTERDLWDSTIKDEIIANQGSVQDIKKIPEDLKQIYRTVWEIPQKTIMTMAVERGAFIDQSQALSLHVVRPEYSVLTSMHFYGWKQGLKTGAFKLYIKTAPKGQKIVSSEVKPPVKKEVNGEMEIAEDVEVDTNYKALVCSLRNPEGCEMCGA